MNRQQGFSFFGLLFFICVMAAIISVVIKVLPPYMDFLTIADATRQTLEQPRIALQTNDSILKKIDNQVSINNIELRDLGKDAIVFRKEDGRLIAEIDYIIEAPVYMTEEAEFVLHMHFVRTVDVRANTTD